MQRQAKGKKKARITVEGGESREKTKLNAVDKIQKERQDANKSRKVIKQEDDKRKINLRGRILRGEN